MTAKPVIITEEDYREYLLSVYGEVEICGLTYNASEVFEDYDPANFESYFEAYVQDQGMNWYCDKCDREYDTEEAAEKCCSEIIKEPGE